MQSRKYKLALLCITLIILAGLFTVALPAFNVALETVVGGIVAIFAIYGGANIGNKWVTGRQAYSGRESTPDDILEAEQKASD